ncbi:hypothetical protein DL93DRAFT_2078310, partial [Clavulina sp. PMI_390]
MLPQSVSTFVYVSLVLALAILTLTVALGVVHSIRDFVHGYRQRFLGRHNLNCDPNWLALFLTIQRSPQKAASSNFAQGRTHHSL